MYEIIHTIKMVQSILRFGKDRQNIDTSLNILSNSQANIYCKKHRQFHLFTKNNADFMLFLQNLDVDINHRFASVFDVTIKLLLFLLSLPSLVQM
jgi:hypothetical protein